MPSEAGETDLEGVLRIEGAPLRSSRDVANYFGVAHGRMLWTLYKAPDDVRYRHFEIPKRTGGMRPIHSPRGMVRDLQDALKSDLDKLYRAHPNAHGFIAARNVATNAASHVGKRWVYNVDLEDFFPTINFGRVRGLFMRPPFDMAPPAAAVCAQIVTYRNGLPQGASTSPVLSNLIARALDRNLLLLARRHRLAYSRYADDITFSSNDSVFPAHLAIQEPMLDGGTKIFAGDALTQVISQCGFTINSKKVRLQRRGTLQSVTGLPVNTRVNVARERIRRIRAMLHAWSKFGVEAAGNEHFTKYRARDMTNGPKDSGRAFRNIVYGHLSFVKMVRGAADPVFLNLCARLLELDPNPSRFLRQMVFGADDYDVFISHATEDKVEVARPIFQACEKAGIKAFLDEEHIAWGESFTKKINTALGASRTVLAIVSGNSVAKEWPVTEVNAALALEIEGAKNVLVVLVGKPDLTRLPLIKTKNYMVWDGNAGKIAAKLKEKVRPPAPEPAVPAKAAASVPAVARASAYAMPPLSGPPLDAVGKRRGWFSRLWRRKK